jgi:cysteinyl-tRNA synthetase, unknown class
VTSVVSGRLFALSTVAGLVLFVTSCVLLVASCVASRRSVATGPEPTGDPAAGRATSGAEVGPRPAQPTAGWVYQLQGYADDRLASLARSPQRLAVVDLARDAGSDFFTAAEIARLRASGKVVLAYFEIGSIERFRPEYPTLPEDLVLNQWDAWPKEFFVRYWDQRWWDDVVRPRLDQALRAGFDGAYLDTPLAYEEIDLDLVDGRTRASLAADMVDLIVRISGYAKQRRPGFWIVPQNSPELRLHGSGYTKAIDAIGMEEMFFRATDEPCAEAYCVENLGNARALRDAGKLVLAVDYAVKPDSVTAVCARYRAESFAGYVARLELDRAGPPCPN